MKRIDAGRVPNGRDLASETFRRTVLAGIGFAIATAGYTYMTPPRKQLQSSGTSSSNESEDWEAAADMRIREHRTTSLEITVVDSDGEPIPEADVDIEMQSHAFGFGTAVDARQLVVDSEPGDQYRSVIPDLFNKAVLENHHKWRFWEDPSERWIADRATEWLLSRGLDMRGHACIWQRRGEGAIPDDVLDAIDRGDREYVAQRTGDHVWSIVDHYSDFPRLVEWDVLNEPVEHSEMVSLIDPDSSPINSPTIGEWYEKANEADPTVRLFVNEYSILAGNDEGHRDTFEELIRNILENGGQLDGLGLQSHHWNVDQRQTPTQLLATLDRFADLVPVIQITEYDTWGDGWTEEMQAEYLFQFLKTVFSHPAVDSFLMWGFWDGNHWQDDGPLFRDDWSQKPAYDVYTELLFEEWWTETSVRTDSDGNATAEAFLGEYELTIRANGRTETVSKTFDDPTSEHVLLRIDA